MVVVKKLIALALVAAFLVSAAVGCSGSPTTGSGKPAGTPAGTPK
jgi:hypothetical protein